MQDRLKSLLYGLAALVVLVIVGYYFWSQDNKLRQYGIARIEAMPISSNDKLMYRALANHYHLYAANSGPRVSKRSTGTPSENGYWEALKAFIDADLAKLREQPKYSEIAGATYLWREDRSNYLLKLEANGSYEKTMYWDADKKFSDPVESEKGVWKAESGTFHWTPATGTPTTQEIIRLGREGIVLKIDGNTASYWKRYN